MSEKLDEILELLRAQNEKVERLEKIEKVREIEGTLGGDDNGSRSQMLEVGGGHRDIGGEFDALFTKSRFFDKEDLSRSIEPFVIRLFMAIPVRTRFGGCSIMIPVEEWEKNKDDYDELDGFEVFPGVVEWPDRNGELRDCIEVFVDISSARARAVLKARFALMGGGARVETIHDNSASQGGQAYLDYHVPAPGLKMPDYKNKKPVAKSEVADTVLGDN